MVGKNFPKLSDWKRDSVSVRSPLAYTPQTEFLVSVLTPVACSETQPIRGSVLCVTKTFT